MPTLYHPYHRWRHKIALITTSTTVTTLTIATIPATTITSPADTTDPAILVRPDWACLADPADPADSADLPGTITEVRFRGPHTDYHLTTPAGPLLIRDPGPPRAAPGPVRWSLLRLRLLPRA